GGSDPIASARGSRGPSSTPWLRTALRCGRAEISGVGSRELGVGSLLQVPYPALIHFCSAVWGDCKRVGRTLDDGGSLDAMPSPDIGLLVQRGIHPGIGPPHIARALRPQLPTPNFQPR